MYDTQCCCYFARYFWQWAKKGQISRVDQLFQHLKLGSLSNDDSDDKENGKKVGLDWQNNSFAFLYISLSSLHTTHRCTQRETPIFTYCGGREHKTTISFSFPKLRYSPSVFNSRKFAIICRIERDGIKAIKFVNVRNLFLRDVFVAFAVVVALTATLYKVKKQ